MPGAFGTGRRRRRCAPRPRAEPGTDGIDLVAEVTTPSRTRSATAAGVRDRRLRLRHQAHDPAPPRRARHGRGRAGVDDRRRRRSPASPTACSCRTAPATRPSVAVRRRRDPRRCSARVPIFGICLGHQLLGRALGGDTVKLPFGHHGANHPVKDLDDRARSRSRARTTTSPSPPTRLGGVADADPRQPQRRRLRGAAVPGDADAFSVQHHPEAGPGPHDSQLPVRTFAA